jgi:hypothetical protein
VSPEERPARRPVPPADERSAHAFADGYGEGLRDGLRDVLQQASRGHTAQELRWLIESRLARVQEEVELKRRALLGPPRRPDWDTLLRPPSPATPTPETALLGTGVLYREDRPTKARSLAAARWSPFGRVIALGRNPSDGLSIPPASLSVLLFAPKRIEGDAEGRVDPSEAAGQVRQMLSEGPALVYLDSLDFLDREYGPEMTVKFVEFLAAQVREASGLLVVSVNPSTVEELVVRRLQGLFENVR